MKLLPKNHPQHHFQDLWLMLQSDQTTISEFEKAFARKVHAPDAVLFPHARVAIQAALETLPNKGPEVLLSAYSCVVVGHAVVLSGLQPRFIDINLEDYNSGPSEFADRVKPGASIGLATHMYGNPVDMKKMETELSSVDAWVEDSSLALHPAYEPIKKPCITVYSMGFNKILSTINGGVAVTHDKNLAQKLRAFRDTRLKATNPIHKTLELVRFVGVYSLFEPQLYSLFDKIRNIPVISEEIDTRNPDEPLFPKTALFQSSCQAAALGLSQLNKADAFLESRRHWAHKYYDAFKNVEGIIPMRPSIDSHFSHYPARVPDRDIIRVRENAKNKGVELGRTLDYALTDLPYYRKYKDSNFPNVEIAAAEIINLPNYPALTEQDFQKVVSVLTECLEKI